MLRAKGIIPQKEKEITEEDLVKMVENTIEQKSQGKAEIFQFTYINWDH